jgi:hypothetical protein
MLHHGFVGALPGALAVPLRRQEKCAGMYILALFHRRKNSWSMALARHRYGGTMENVLIATNASLSWSIHVLLLLAIISP